MTRRTRQELKNNSVMIATDWQYDLDFVALLENTIRAYGCSSIVVSTDNLNRICHEIQSGKLHVMTLIDRASDTTPVFIRLQSMLHELGVRIIDPIEQIRWVSDKATLHLEFLSAEIPTPYTLILPPYEENNIPALHVDDLAHLGRPFVIKPANTTGGGVGVVNGAESLQEILHARTELQSDKYLLQERIVPLEMEGYRFWFRCFYTGGRIFTTWWNDKTHRYTLIDDELFDALRLDAIPELMHKIAQVAMLTFFSSEIVYCERGRWIVVDYINESCDMRFQSKHWDGVPDELVNQIAEALIQSVISDSQQTHLLHR